VLMTCVSGHLTDAQFDSAYSKWDYPPPESLFAAPVRVKVKDVCDDFEPRNMALILVIGERSDCYKHCEQCTRSQSSLHLDRL
jgi:hypothetical protein